MVDHIHFPKRVGPLFPTERVKKVRRRKDRQQDAGFKENLDKEKKNPEDGDENAEEPGHSRSRADSARIADRNVSGDTPAASGEKKTAGETAPEKRIDVHA
jgi:hypothetical protein